MAKKENTKRKSKNSVSPRLLSKLSSALTSVKKEGQERINALRRNLEKKMTLKNKIELMKLKLKQDVRWIDSRIKCAS